MTPTNRPPVVLLHALPLDSSMWDTQARRLRARGHPVLTYDQRGFGGTPLGTDPPSLDLVADDLARRMDRRGMTRAVVVGASMGGYVAMAFLRRHRARVLGLGLLSTRGTADTAKAAAERRGFAERILDDSLRDQLVARTTPMLLGATTRAEAPDTVARVVSLAAAAAPEAVAWAQRAIAARPGAMDDLRTTDVPALVVAGEEDELVSLHEARHLTSTLPQGRLVTVPRAGHLPPVEAPQRTTDALVELLDTAGAAERNGADAC
ncbi:alpha/beta fold hydrolase [Streptomyces sp. NPDC050355]|uniref:alpha/beta fold hydrolase n=1 Tax=Streptomyces sp. NPDC050355 TaxID=3365609 RepID=UPI0037985AE7